MESDLVIIGGGMSGAVAALTAAKRGKRVLLLTANPGATAMFSGIFDVSQNPASKENLRRASAEPLLADLTAIAEQNPYHPYAAVSDYANSKNMEKTETELKESFATFADALATAGLPIGNDLERRLLVSTASGAARTTRVALSSIEKGDLFAMNGAAVHIVGIRGITEFNANFIARSLKFLLNRMRPGAVSRFTFSEVAFPGYEESLNLNGIRIAELLDHPETLSAFAENARSGIPGSVTHVAFPPLLGLWGSDISAAYLERTLQLPCFEVAAVQHGVPGLRLQAALDAALGRAGVAKLIGRVTKVSVSENRVESLRFQPENGEETEITGARYVLATGRFISGGLEQRETMREPIFDLPVFWKKRPVRGSLMADMVTPVITDKQMVFSSGVRVDAALRPLNENDEPIYDNLMAAGSVIGGYDALRDRCGAGVAVLTGYLAGVAAAGGQT